jgi:hypothetical protein
MRTALTVDEDWIDAEVTPSFQAQEEHMLDQSRRDLGRD